MPNSNEYIENLSSCYMRVCALKAQLILIIHLPHELRDGAPISSPPFLYSSPLSITSDMALWVERGPQTFVWEVVADASGVTAGQRVKTGLAKDFL